jgi:hypothetical protein
VPDKLFAIPWETLTLDPVRKCFVMDMPLHKLDEAPSFGQGEHTDKADDAQWVENLHRYFGTQPSGKA